VTKAAVVMMTRWRCAVVDVNAAGPTASV
jgi:hypothetical protein